MITSHHSCDWNAVELPYICLQLLSISRGTCPHCAGGVGGEMERKLPVA